MLVCLSTHTYTDIFRTSMSWFQIIVDQNIFQAIGICSVVFVLILWLEKFLAFLKRN